MDWTDETIVRLRSLWDEGHSTAEIGRRLGVTKNAVVGKAHRLNLPARPSPIRRASGGAVPPRRSSVRRVSGPTLPALASASTPLRAESMRPESMRLESGRPESMRLESGRPESGRAESVRESTRDVARGSPVLRAVPQAPRPTGRVSACCWPIGEPGTPSFRFCNDGAIHGKPYCGEHASLAYVRVRDRREDAA